MDQIQEKYFVSDKAVELLKILKKSGKWQLPAELAIDLKLRREALFEAIDELFEIGYGLEFHPYFGLRLINLPNAFIPGEITNNLNVNVINKDLKILKGVTSSIKSAFQMLESGDADEGTIVLADEQPEIKTWVDHDWFSTGIYGICLAIVLKLPSLEVEKSKYLNLIGTLSIAYTLTDNIHIPAKIVFPSSIYVYNKKIGDVIVKHNVNFPDYLVMGINVNVNMDEDDFPEEFAGRATSVKIESGHSVNRNEILRYLLFNLDNLVNKLRKRKYRPLEMLWRDYCALTPRAEGEEIIVLVKTNAGEFEGSVISSDPIAGIRIKLASTNDEKSFTIDDVESVTIQSQ